MWLKEHSWGKFPGDRQLLEQHLGKVWATRSVDYCAPEDREEKKKGVQRFLTFSDDRIKAHNYVGFIRVKEFEINIYPKVFSSEDPDAKDLSAHFLWWLSHSARFKLPRNRAGSDRISQSLLEVFIWCFSSYTKEVLHLCYYQQYEDVEKSLPFVKGRIDMPRYIGNLANAEWHRIPCRFDSFEIDNQMNRVIKAVSAMLLGRTRESENKKNLRDILFLLDEVGDIRATIADCRSIKLNQTFSLFFPVLEYCETFLADRVVWSDQSASNVFSFLVPMEKIFEDFVGGMLKNHFGAGHVTPQASGEFLAEVSEDDAPPRRVFQMKNDFLLNLSGEKPILIDAKHKILKDEDDHKYGVAQSDLYQMVTYAVRRGMTRCALIYPCPNGQEATGSKVFTVKDSLADGKSIRIYAIKIPFVRENPEELSFPEMEERCKEVLHNTLLREIQFEERIGEESAVSV